MPLLLPLPMRLIAFRMAVPVPFRVSVNVLLLGLSPKLKLVSGLIVVVVRVLSARMDRRIRGAALLVNVAIGAISFMSSADIVVK